MPDVLRIMVDIFQLRSSAVGKKGERWTCEEDAFSPRHQVKPTTSVRSVRVLNDKHWDPSIFLLDSKLQTSPFGNEISTIRLQISM